MKHGVVVWCGVVYSEIAKELEVAKESSTTAAGQVRASRAADKATWGKHLSSQTWGSEYSH